MHVSASCCNRRFWRLSVLMPVVALLGTALTCLAVHKEAQPSFLLSTWDSEDGLPAASIRDIARTPDGYLWIATDDGLVRFDGARFVVLTTNDIPALQDDHTSCLLVDSTGDLWVGTDAGTLVRRQDGRFASVPLGPKFQQKPVLALAQDKTGAVWIAAGNELLRIHNGITDVFGTASGLPGKWISQIVTDGNGRVWAITGGKLWGFDGNTWKSPDVPGPEGSTVQAVAKARDGGIWVATIFSKITDGRGGRILKFKNGEWISDLPAYPWPYATMPPHVVSVLEDAGGNIWLGTYDAGLLYLDPEQKWQQLAGENGSRQIIVRCIASDATGLVWVGYGRSHELQQVRPRPVKILHLPPSAGRSRVFATCAARDGSIWIGTSDAGIFRYRDGRFEHYGDDEGLSDPHIGAILEDSHSNLWVGTWGGLFRLNGTQFVPIEGPDALDSRILSLCEDDRGNLWVGGSAVVRLGPDGTNVFGPQQGIAGNSLWGMAKDRDGSIWVASSGRGLYHQVGDHFKRYGAGKWAGETKVRALYVDAADTLWMATWGDGLYRLRNGVLDHWSTSDGLPSEMIHAIIQDAAGNLWFSSDNGFFGCPRRQFDDYVPGKSLPLLFWHLTMADGLDSKMGSGAGEPAVARSADGRLWFPNQYALAEFDPASCLHARSVTPQIENVLADGAVCPRETGGTVRVKSSARGYEFHFTAPNLDTPEEQWFLYRLKGWDENWMETRHQRVAHYNRLPPGQYEFDLMAAGRDGEWHAARSPVELAVMPLFWERPWTKPLAVAVLLLATGAGAWWLKSRHAHRLHVLELERRRIARDLHDDLGSRLTEVMLIGQAVESAADSMPEVRQLTGQMLSKTRQSISAMDEIVWTVNPENDTLANLVGYVSDFAQEFLALAGISCRLDVPPNLPDAVLPAPVRHSLFLAVKEALNNAARHSGASEVWLVVTCSNQELCLTVQDNGCGFAPTGTEYSGNGLQNLRQRLEAIGGSAKFSSPDHGGTSACFCYPIRATSLTVQREVQSNR